MSSQTVFFAAIRSLLRPLVRILLKNGIPYGAFLDIVKPIYIEMAARESEKSGKKTTNSRIATITGISRKEVQRIKENEVLDDIWAFDRYNRAARVVTGWVRDSRFLDKQGQPAVLSYNTSSPSFVELVAAYSGDIPAKTILEELQEADVVGVTKSGDIQLLKRVYIPSGVKSEKLGILGRDVAGLINTIGHNIYEENATPYFQRKVFYDNLPEEYIPYLKAFIENNAQSLLEKIDRDMSANDRDANPAAVKGSGRKAAGIGIYYFEEEIPLE